MADGYFERGEIYWVNVDPGVIGSRVARPGVIVSAGKLNRSGQIVLAMLTRAEKKYPWDIPTDATGKASVVKCDCILTTSSQNLGKCIGVMNDHEMRQVGRGLEEVLGLGYVDDGKDAEIAILKAKLEAAEEAKKDELLSLRMESEMWQKLYMKALDQVVNTKFGADVAIRTERKPAVVPKPVKVESPVEPKPPVTEGSGSTDINHCTETELKKLGFSTAMARLIVSYRPFKDVPDLKRVPGMSKVKYQIIEQKVCCTPVVVEKPVIVKDEPDTGFEPEPKKYGKSNIVWDGVKVNVNTVRTGEEIFKRTGLNMKACTEIVKYRKENGSYEKVEDLLKLERFGPIVMKRYGHMLEV